MVHQIWPQKKHFWNIVWHTLKEDLSTLRTDKSSFNPQRIFINLVNSNHFEEVKVRLFYIDDVITLNIEIKSRLLRFRVWVLGRSSSDA